MKKIFKMLLLVFFLLIIFIYTIVIENIPNQIIVFQGEEVSMRTLFGIGLRPINKQTLETSSYIKNGVSQNIGKTDLNLSLFEKIPLKDVEVNVIPKTKVIPVGSIAGVKLYTNGVLVVGMSEIEGIDNKKYKPYENTGIKEGDTITKIDEHEISSTNDLIKTVNMSNGNNIRVQYIHDEETKECSIIPIETSNNEYKIGLWVRDSAARCWNSNIL